MENLNFDTIKNILKVIQDLAQQLVKFLLELLNIKYGDETTAA